MSKKIGIGKQDMLQAQSGGSERSECHGHPEVPLLSYPVLEVLAPVVQDVLELDDAVGHKVVVSNGSIMEDGQLNPAAVVDLRGELIIPGWAIGLLLGGGLAHTGIIHVQGDVRVQQEGLSLWTYGVTEGPSCRFEVQSLTDFDLQLPVEDHHDAPALITLTWKFFVDKNKNNSLLGGEIKEIHSCQCQLQRRSTGGAPGRH